MMILRCPCCGARCSIEAWLNEQHVGECLRIAAGLAKVGPRILRYVAMFRPMNRGLAWPRAAVLMGEAAALVTAGHIQHKGQVARPIDPGIWADAFDVLFTRNLQLPLDNHGYLKAIAYDLADGRDRKNEVSRNVAERTGTWKRPAQEPLPDNWDSEELRQERIRLIREFKSGNNEDRKEVIE